MSGAVDTTGCNGPTGVAEKWRPVVGFEGWYLVSSLGRVMRVKPAPGATSRHILKSRRDRSHWDHGYLKVHLSKENGKHPPSSIHVLVAEAFLGPRPPGHDVDHIDHDRQNNRIDNLRYLPISQNRSQRVCGECGGQGHNRRTCEVRP